MLTFSQNATQAKDTYNPLSSLQILALEHSGKFGLFELTCTALCPITVLSEQSLASSYNKQRDLCFILPGAQCTTPSSISPMRHSNERDVFKRVLFC